MKPPTSQSPRRNTRPNTSQVDEETALQARKLLVRLDAATATLVAVSKAIQICLNSILKHVAPPAPPPNIPAQAPTPTQPPTEQTATIAETNPPPQ